jgi:hypothetical protein
LGSDLFEMESALPNTFELNHQRIILPRTKKAIRQCVLRVLRKILNQPVDLSSQGLIGKSKIIRTLYAAFGALIEETLHDAGVRGLPDHERRLAECLVLHKLETTFSFGPLLNHDDVRMWRAVVGSMGVTKLALALLELTREQAMEVLDWSMRIDGINRSLWVSRFKGARSTALFLDTACRVEEHTQVFLSTTYEDVALSVDGFIVAPEQGVELAVDIRTAENASRQSVKILKEEMDSASPNERTSSKVVRGALMINDRYSRSFVPTQILTPSNVFGRITSNNEDRRRYTFLIRKAAQLVAAA